MWQATVQHLHARCAWRHLLRGVSGLANERHHAATTGTGSHQLPGAPPPVSGSSPGLAALLGFIPGVGAMYNGEYTKGFIHVLIFASLIWATDHVNDLFGLGIAAFVLYMPIEAYQTAKAKLMGSAASRSVRA